MDAARALALVGMMAVHILPTERADGGATAAGLIAAGRSAALFAVLAGVGVGLARPPAAALLTRAVLVFAIGLGLAAAPTGLAVILCSYGLLFAVAVGLRRLPTPALLASGLLLVAAGPAGSLLLRPHLPAFSGQNPAAAGVIHRPLGLLAELAFTGYYPVSAFSAYLVAGLLLARCRLGDARTAAALTAGGVVGALAAHSCSAFLLGPAGGRDALARTLPGVSSQDLLNVVDGPFYGTTPTTSGWWLALDARHSSTPLDLAATIAVAAAVLGGCLLLARAAPNVVAALAPTGRMTLTLYCAHALVLALPDPPGARVLVWLVHVSAAVTFAWLWLRRRRRGPLEGVAAALTMKAAQVTGSRR